MQERREEEQKVKKTFAFPAMSNDDKFDIDEDMALFARRFNRFMRKGRFNNKQRYRPESKEEVICYICNKPRHMKLNCPNLKMKSKEVDKL